MSRPGAAAGTVAATLPARSPLGPGTGGLLLHCCLVCMSELAHDACCCCCCCTSAHTRAMHPPCLTLPPHSRAP